MFIKLQHSSSYSRFHLFFLFLLHSFILSCQLKCKTEDERALLRFSGSLSSPSGPLNWSSTFDCCTAWEGVSCDDQGAVIRLWLPCRGLGGNISPSLGSLLALSQLNLSHNSLSGFLPDGLFTSLSSLEILDLSFNGLSGDLSASFASIKEDMLRPTNLRILDLAHNDFSGTIPHDIGKLSNLEELHLNDNFLSGPLSPFFMNCTNLEKLIVQFNSLEGNITTFDFSRLTRLQVLDLGYNNFTGTLPESIYSCKSLTAIRVANNTIKAVGRISPKIVGLSSLSYLFLGQQSFINISEAITILSACKNLTILLLTQSFHDEA